MFLLDTNVLSVLMAAQPPREVAAWLSAQPEDLLFTAAVCQAEILSGLAVLPESRRRSELEAAARAMFLDDFEGRVLRSIRSQPRVTPRSTPGGGEPDGRGRPRI